jgi:hypothetical protein
MTQDGILTAAIIWLALSFLTAPFIGRIMRGN